MKIGLLLLLLVLSFGLKAQLRTDTVNVPFANGANPDVFLAYEVLVDTTTSSVYDSLLLVARSYFGTRYKYGSQQEVAFDCSGFVREVYSQFGYSFPHSSAAQAMLGATVSKTELQVGDLLFFKGRSTKSKRVGHVSIVSSIDEDGSIHMIHASTHAGVIEESVFDKEYYKRRFLLAKRVIAPAPN